MEKICSRCSKPFNPDDKPIKSLDVNGNPLRIDLCSMCELDNAVEEVAELKHISRKEAEKYLYKYMWDEAYKITSNICTPKMK